MTIHLAPVSIFLKQIYITYRAMLKRYVYSNLEVFVLNIGRVLSFLRPVSCCLLEAIDMSNITLSSS